MKYAIGVGSNRGERKEFIARAASMLDDGLHLIAAAPLYTTQAVGGPLGQGAYINTAWLIESELGPHQLLHRLQVIETALGRFRTVPWGSRTMDLDLLLREDGLILQSRVLTIPHPLMHLRAFVVAPLAQIAGAWRHPLSQCTVAELALATARLAPS